MPLVYVLTAAQCNEAYASNDVIPILPTVATDIARLSQRVKTLKEKGFTHALKKAPGSKKRKKNAEKETNSDALTTQTTTTDKDPSSENNTQQKLADMGKLRNASVPNNAIKNASTASLTKRVLEEQEENNKRRKLEQNANVKSLFSKGNAKPAMGNSADFMTRGFTVGAKK
jgi:hypothetical protein